MPGQEKLPVGFVGYKRAGVGAEVVTKFQDVDNVADRLAHFAQKLHVALHQGIHQPVNVFGLEVEVRQEIVEAAKESAPFKEVATYTQKQRFVGFEPQVDGFITEHLPETGFVDPIVRGKSETSPDGTRHLVAQIIKAVRIAIPVGKNQLVEEGCAHRHFADKFTTLAGREPRAVRLPDGVEPFGIKGGGPGNQFQRLPVIVGGIEFAANIEDIDAEMVEQFHLRLCNLLDHIIDLVFQVAHAEMVDQALIGYHRNAAAGRCAEVDRDAVGLPVVDGSKNSFS